MSAKRPTPHQQEVLDRLTRRSRQGTRPVAEAEIGSIGALEHLAAKGYAHVDHIERGPRGGEYRYWLPGTQVQVGAEEAVRAAERRLGLHDRTCIKCGDVFESEMPYRLCEKCA